MREGPSNCKNVSCVTMTSPSTQQVIELAAQLCYSRAETLVQFITSTQRPCTRLGRNFHRRPCYPEAHLSSPLILQVPPFPTPPTHRRMLHPQHMVIDRKPSLPNAMHEGFRVNRGRMKVILTHPKVALARIQGWGARRQTPFSPQARKGPFNSRVPFSLPFVVENGIVLVVWRVERALSCYSNSLSFGNFI